MLLPLLKLSMQATAPEDGDKEDFTIEQTTVVGSTQHKQGICIFMFCLC